MNLTRETHHGKPYLSICMKCHRILGVCVDAHIEAKIDKRYSDHLDRCLPGFEERVYRVFASK